MSDMKTFTIRDLDRQPAKVLAAADHHGVARVRSRDGRTYAIRPEAPAAGRKPDWKRFVREHRAWRKQLYPEPLAWTREQIRELDRLTASDGRLL